MGGKAYPAPSRHRWTVAVEFLDGTRIEAADDADAMERWGRLLGWTESRYLSAAEVKVRAARFARAFYGARLPPGVERFGDAEFLDVLSEAGVLAVIRR